MAHFFKKKLASTVDHSYKFKSIFPISTEEYFFKWAILGLSFVFSTISCKNGLYKLPIAGFKPGHSGP